MQLNGCRLPINTKEEEEEEELGRKRQRTTEQTNRGFVSFQKAPEDAAFEII